MIDYLAELVATSALREYVLWALMNVPGLPPIAQAIHIMAIAVVTASAIMIALRFLNLAVPSQSPTEMISRLMPWTWWALLVLLSTGGLFVIARPNRYFYNPIAQWKFSLLAGALVLALVVHLINKKSPGFWEVNNSHLLAARGISFVALLLWVGVIFAGRWIAYLDYIIY
jgi:hypothetical protein